MKNMHKLYVDPPSIDERLFNALSNINLDVRLEEAIVALEISQKALTEALDMTTEIQSGVFPSVNGLDEEIQTSLEAIGDVLLDEFTVTNRKRLMKRIVRTLEKFAL